MRPLVMALDNQGRNTYAREQSDSIYSGIVGAVAQAINMPAGAKYALFSATGSIAVKVGGTAVYPTGNIASGGSELNPTILYIAGASTISIISDTSTAVSVSFYS